MRAAPCSTACRATSALQVSIETGTRSRGTRRRSTGTTRRTSSSAGTCAAPGRVDSPPTSMMSAPSASSRSAAATAWSGSGYAPPSANESGVTLMIPITSVRSPSASVRPPGRPSV